MKNYTYGWKLKEQGYVEVPEEQYTDRQKDMQAYINVLSEAICNAQCGWDGVEYKAMKHTNGSLETYMRLWVKDGGSRWIPITGNSKGCNLSVLGENLW